MPRRRLVLACRIHSALVIAAMFFVIGVFAASELPLAPIRGNELVLWRAEDVALLGSLLSLLIGVTMCAGCVLSGVEPPDLLARCTLAALLLSAIAALLLPAIQTA